MKYNFNKDLESGISNKSSIAISKLRAAVHICGTDKETAIDLIGFLTELEEWLDGGHYE